MLESSTTSRNNYSTNLMVIEFAFDSASAMYFDLVLERGELVQLSARSYDSSSPPQPSEKIRIRTSSGAEGGYLRAVRREVSLSGSR